MSAPSQVHRLNSSILGVPRVMQRPVAPMSAQPPFLYGVHPPRQQGALVPAAQPRRGRARAPQVKGLRYLKPTMPQKTEAQLRKEAAKKAALEQLNCEIRRRRQGVKK